jgi:periplasmic protein CpxP/Spy
MERETTSTGRRWFMDRRFFYAALGGTALAGLFAVGPIAAAVAGHRGGGWGGPFGHHGFHGNPEAAREHIQVAVKWALKSVDATPEQQQRVGAIVDDCIEDVAALKDEHRKNREAFAARLGDPTVDREALESIRKAEIALADQASQKLVSALAEAAQVLRPEQRAELLQHAQRFHR